MVQNWHTFDLNEKQLYRPAEVQEKYQIRKPHRLHVHHLKELMRINPYAHVVGYLVLVDLKDVPVRDTFDESKCFDDSYYVLWGNHSTEARRESMQEFPKNLVFQIVKCIIYVGLTDVEEKLLAWDHNIDSDYRMSMTFIQRVRFSHNEFEQICGGDRLKVDAES